MSILLRRGGLVPLLFLLASSLAAAEPLPWDQPAFTADPRALLAAAQKVKADDYSAVYLLDESDFVIHDDRGAETRSRVMTYIVTDAGVDNASEIRAYWMPWVDARPAIEARIITKEGTVHRLDQSAVVEVPADEEGDIFSDGRVLRAPLPAVAAGSVVEYVIIRSSKSPIAGGGISEHYYFGGYLPTERTRVTINRGRGGRAGDLGRSDRRLRARGRAPGWRPGPHGADREAGDDDPRPYAGDRVDRARLPRAAHVLPP